MERKTCRNGLVELRLWEEIGWFSEDEVWAVCDYVEASRRTDGAAVRRVLVEAVAEVPAWLRKPSTGSWGERMEQLGQRCRCVRTRKAASAVLTARKSSRTKNNVLEPWMLMLEVEEQK